MARAALGQWEADARPYDGGYAAVARHCPFLQPTEPSAGIARFEQKPDSNVEYRKREDDIVIGAIQVSVIMPMFNAMPFVTEAISTPLLAALETARSGAARNV